MESSKHHLTLSVAADTGPTRTESAQGGVVRPVHGGVKPAELRKLGLDPQQVLDFSASISPLGPPTGIWDAMHRVDLTAYPDPECLELREALSARSGVEPARILVGNGSTELIHLLARAYLSSPREGNSQGAFLLTPTYGEYTGACRLVGASVSGLSAQSSTGFCWDLAEAQRRIIERRPGLTFVCNPNNPTGVYLGEADVMLLIDAVETVGGLLVLDEAYLSFVDQAWASLALLEHENVVLLRSLTKDYALTGLRLGYSLASKQVTERLGTLQPDWSVNSLAQAGGLVALGQTEYLSQARQAVNQSKEYLTEKLSTLGFKVLPSSANFLLVQVGNGLTIRNQLLHRGIVVRDCASFGLPECIRIGIRALPDCQRLVKAMQEALKR